MTKLEQAARQALEALEIYGEHAKDCPQYPTYTRPQDYPKCDCGFEEAIAALREALEQYALLHRIRHRGKSITSVWIDELNHSGEANEMVTEQAEQEPVAWHHPKCDGQCIACLIEKAVEDAYGTQGRDYMLRHINAAPVRTKNLTDDEILEISLANKLLLELCYGQMFEMQEVTTDLAGLTKFARAVIAADREKNK